MSGRPTPRAEARGDPKIERIVVPFDATSEARGAIAVAARLAARTKRSCTVSLSRTKLCCIWRIRPSPGMSR
jgi:hypothetical protein